jgi:CRP-like cAMP-binding protein
LAETSRNGTTIGSLRQLGLDAEGAAMLCTLPLFEAVDEPQLMRLLTGAAVRRYEPNAILFLKGEPATRFFIVLEGWIRLFRETLDGQETTIGIFGQGESVAEVAMLDSGSYPVSGSVITRARLLTVPAGNFLEQIRSSPELALNLLASMSRHLNRLVRQVEQLTNRSSVQRVADFLFRLCPPGEPCAEIELPLDKARVAACLGMQPETLSRSLARLRGAGVETMGSRIVVNDVARLRQLADRRTNS